MSLLDENLVDQESIEMQFRLMLGEMYDRLKNGTLSAEDFKKNPKPERVIGGIPFRIVKSDYSKDNCGTVFEGVGSVVNYVMEPKNYINCSEYEKFKDKEYVNNLAKDLLDLYWGKELYEGYKFEYKVDGQWNGNDYYIVSFLDILLWRERSLKEIILTIERDMRWCLERDELKEFKKLVDDWKRSEGIEGENDSIPF